MIHRSQVPNLLMYVAMNGRVVYTTLTLFADIFPINSDLINYQYHTVKRTTSPSRRYMHVSQDLLQLYILRWSAAMKLKLTWLEPSKCLGIAPEEEREKEWKLASTALLPSELMTYCEAAKFCLLDLRCLYFPALALLSA